MRPVSVMGTVYLSVIRQVLCRVVNTAGFIEMVDTKGVRQAFEIARDYELRA
jgi:hypothetical protein